ncbi:hypothetical protein PMAYCL1PPCAC_02158, partial [Pristionchus mayeri]
QMLFSILVASLAAIAASAAESCKCVNVDQRIDPVSNPIIFFQQPTVSGEMNGVTCSSNCHLEAHLDVDDDKYALEIQLLSNNLQEGQLEVKGLSEDVTITSKTQPAILIPKSKGDSIAIEFTQPTGMKGEFLMAIRKVPRPSPHKSDSHRI